MNCTRYLLGASVIALAGAAHAATFNEGFNDAAALPAAGWAFVNNSTPAGQSWFQGDNTAAFAAQSGPVNSYIAGNFLSSLNGAGPVDLWLISPSLLLGPAPSVSFYARSAPEPGFDDRLEVRFTSGAGAATASFTTLLSSVTLPTSDWNFYSVALPGASPNGRVAFRYVAGFGNYIGIDNVTFNVTAIPEPPTYLLLFASILTMAWLQRRRGA